MADVEFARNEIADPQLARQVVAEITDVAAGATSFDHDVLSCSILDEGLHLDISVEGPGWTETVAVRSPALPGAVRGAVEKLLRDLGLTSI
jgi:hypothetical protein